MGPALLQMYSDLFAAVLIYDKKWTQRPAGYCPAAKISVIEPQANISLP